MAASVVKRRYVSAVYEDKYFPEKNAAIPFKWEASPGKPKYDDDGGGGGGSKDDSKQGSFMHNMCDGSYTYSTKDNHQCMQESHIHTPHAHAGSIYPLRPPPRVSPVSPLRVKDVLLHGSVRDHDLSDDRFDDDDRCPLHAYHHSFSRLSIRFRSLKASTVVPVYKDHCVIKRSQNLGVDKSPASSLVMHAPNQGRSQSFNHAAMHRAGRAAKRAANGSDVVGDASVQAPGRRCNSFNLHSAPHSLIEHDHKVHDDDDDVDNDVDGDTASMAAAAVWAGACILAAAGAHDVVSADHHQHGPCRVAMKLRDLMQQSANLADLELPTMMKLKNGGGSTINENLPQLALCHATITPAAKRKTKSLEEEVMEAFLREGIRKSCTHDEDDDDGEDFMPTKEKAAHEGDDKPGKLVKKKGFLKVFKNECIACWCPSSTL